MLSSQAINNPQHELHEMLAVNEKPNNVSMISMAIGTFLVPKNDHKVNHDHLLGLPTSKVRNVIEIIMSSPYTIRFMTRTQRRKLTQAIPKMLTTLTISDLCN